MHAASPAPPRVRWLGRVDYVPTWHAMQKFTAERGSEADDEIWLLEHEPVFTLGMNGSPAHVLAAGDIPVVNIDRGGQVTYHGPGQLVLYPLLELKRWQLGVRELVVALETAVIRLAALQGLDAHGKREAPGVYVAGRKLASIGLRIRRGCSYHGLALNVAMDLAPFGRINPCGFAGLEVVDLASLGVMMSVRDAGDVLAREFAAVLEERRAA
ncbi:MAG: lipoyl(octanoyl) transferase LipB [Steroidobacteraceae bacterium]